MNQTLLCLLDVGRHYLVVSIQKRGIFFLIEAFDRFNHRHIITIPRIKF